MSDDNEGWIEHDGNGIPVEASTLVAVKFRDGSSSFVEMEATGWESDTYSPRDFWVFNERYPSTDIIAYSVVKP